MAETRLTSPVMLTPAGNYLVISEEVFDAFQDFVNERRTGSVQVNFRDGGIASVDATYRKSYPKVKNNSHGK